MKSPIVGTSQAPPSTISTMCTGPRATARRIFAATVSRGARSSIAGAAAAI